MSETKPRLAVGYHFFNDFDTAPAMMAAVRKTYDGPVALAQDYMAVSYTHLDVYKRQVDSPQVKLDVLAGARMLDIEQTLDLSGNGPLGLSVNSKLSKTLWDGIVGVKGQVALGDERKWFIPYYLDVGTGQTDLTWHCLLYTSRCV